MTTHALHEPVARPYSARWLIVGFLAGAVAVLLFHQGAAAALHALGLTPRAPFSLQPTKPFGVPVITSIAFWGGVWGVLLAAAFARLSGARLLLASTIF